MARFERLTLSGSTNGRPIQVAATATPGDTVHTAHATALDEVDLWCTNRSAGAVLLTLEVGGVGAGDTVEISIPANDTRKVLEGVPLTGGVEIAAFAATTNVLSVFGHVTRIG